MSPTWGTIQMHTCPSNRGLVLCTACLQGSDTARLPTTLLSGVHTLWTLLSRRTTWLWPEAWTHCPGAVTDVPPGS